MSPTRTTEQFIEKAIAKHGHKWDYSRAVYKGAKKPIEVGCKEHGFWWVSKAENHTSSTSRGRKSNGKPKKSNGGCLSCNITAKKTTEQFIKDARTKHGHKWDYSRSVYKNRRTLLEVGCKEHGFWWTTPHRHLSNGCGCPNCGGHGYKTNKEGLLYYLRVTDPAGVVRYKIGITNKTVQDRFHSRDIGMIDVLGEYRHGNGTILPKKELFIKQHFAHARYTGPDILRSGNTELFNHDVLGLEGGGDLILAVNRLQRAH